MTTDEMRRVAEHLEQRQAEYWHARCRASDAQQRLALNAWFVLTHERWGRSLERLNAHTRVA